MRSNPCWMLKVTKRSSVVKNRRYTILFLLWLTVITTLSLFAISIEQTEQFWYPDIDKLAHFVFYFVLVVLLSFAINEMDKKVQIRKNVLIAVIFSVGYSILMEVLQHLMPYNRSAELFDVLANSVGAITAGLLIVRYRSLIPPLK